MSHFAYAIFDGDGCIYFHRSTEPEPLDQVIQMAEKKIEKLSYDGVAQLIKIYEIELNDEFYGHETEIGQVVVPGRMYQCPACLAIFPHPARELAVCRCGYICDDDNLESADG